MASPSSRSLADLTPESRSVSPLMTEPPAPHMTSHRPERHQPAPEECTNDEHDLKRLQRLMPEVSALSHRRVGRATLALTARSWVKVSA
jgi:hypothetical protein